jgi:mRNA-degrading endonuclease RelE of RelBE toxin-antitoxin system
MTFRLLFTPQSEEDLDRIKNDKSKVKRYKTALKILAYLEANPRHPSLNTHQYHTLKGPNDEKVFEAYVENNTPSAYRIFWHYGPNKNEITILTITKHP